MHDPDPSPLLAPAARCILAELLRRDAAAAPLDTSPRPWIAVQVIALAAACHVAYFTAAHALAALREMGIVETRRHGPDGLTFRLTGEGLDALDTPTPPAPDARTR